ncbi:phage repressor protein CI [Type-D symbiont of Plautia stali]|uniref:phage repressor protein CI n=1 Tax=Type-D symbiont of Plautia stali TaxID=1560356 RepID=UPI00073E213F|nr:phage repressor protein CI [Type-D symbiont of Plautia stali]
MEFNNGGQKVVHRLLEAYGFKTRQALCDKLGVAKSTMASRYMRDIFPADWVIQASIETGVNVEWLSFGTGQMYSNENKQPPKVPSAVLDSGELVSGEFLYFDEELYPENLNSPCLIFVGKERYLIDNDTAEIRDGLWLMDIDGKKSIREVMLLPQHKVRITNEAGSFDCPIQDVNFVGNVSLVMRKG